MADLEKNNNIPEEELEENLVTLVDEETGEELSFIVIDEATLDGELYWALVPADVEEPDEYIILSVTEDGDDLVLASVDDDDEFDKVEDYFNDLFFSEVDYDN